MLRILLPGWSGQLRYPNWLPWLITIVCAATLVPVFYLATFNHPCPADDYQNSLWTSFFGYQADLYLHWSGRYFNNLALALCPLHWKSFTGFRIVVALIMAIFVLSNTLLTMRVIRYSTSAPNSVRIAVAVAATTILFNNFASLAEAFFWYAGAVTYALPAIAAMALLSLLIHIQKQLSITKGKLIFAAVLAALSIGGNEALLVFTDILIFIAWLYYRRFHSQRVQHIFFFRLLLVCILCSAIAILAPGNFARQAVVPHNVAMVIPTWLYFSQKVLYLWLTNPYFLLFSVLVILLLTKYPLLKPRLPLIVAFILPFAIVFLLTLPAHYALGTVPPPRVMNIVYTFFLLAWIYFLMYLASSLVHIVVGDSSLSATIRQMLIIVTAVVLLWGLNTNDLRDANLFNVPKSLIRGIPQSYDAELRHRYAIIRNSSDDSLAVPAIGNIQGNPLYLADINTLPQARTNHYYAVFWGKRIIHVDTSTKHR